MLSVEVIKQGILTTIQDGGRPGYAYYGIPVSGFMDYQSAKLANILVGNPPSSPLLECHLAGPHLRFLDQTWIAVTGANMDWRINGKLVAMNTRLKVVKNDVLTSGKSSDLFRSYIAVSGQLQEKSTLGSLSAYAYAGYGANEGRPLSQGQKLNYKQEIINDNQDVSILQARKFTTKFTFNRGPEFEILEEADIQMIENAIFNVTPDSNRMGARLKGPKVRTDIQLDRSVTTIPGIIQLLPSGQLIVILQDGQTTGGYPRIGYITGKELWQFNQIPLGGEISFTLP